MSEKWSAADVPDLTGKVVVITGANGGLGLCSARLMAGAGATVVMACRDMQKAAAAVEAAERDLPGARLDLRALDLGDLASVRRFAEGFCKDYEQLHVLLNNAGVMAIPRRTTADGFEMQLGINHLGHFALTGRLLEPLLATPGARVVNVASNAHKMGRLHQDDLMLERGYGKWKAYGQSKLANLLFTFELQRRFVRAQVDAIAVAAHPGYSGTDLANVGPRMVGSSAMAWLMGIGNRWLAQAPEAGALPQVYAAVAPGVDGGDYVGPDGIGGWRGHPKKVEARPLARDADLGAWLWDASVERTGVDYAALRR
ncbi:MAG: oxidoreductase, partial [bacterium]